jgi:hypothetical protein
MWPTLVKYRNTQGAKALPARDLRDGLRLLSSTAEEYRRIVELLRGALLQALPSYWRTNPSSSFFDVFTPIYL